MNWVTFLPDSVHGGSTPKQSTPTAIAFLDCCHLVPPSQKPDTKPWRSICLRSGASGNELLSRKLTIKLCCFSQVLVAAWVENHLPFHKSPFEVKTGCCHNCLETVRPPRSLVSYQEPGESESEAKVLLWKLPDTLLLHGHVWIHWHHCQRGGAGWFGYGVGGGKGGRADLLLLLPSLAMGAHRYLSALVVSI